ncbi:hypothetical protein GSI_11267 [Ganoderma sinense ZZ0214-1]|uniref:Uncharacterized protein n=1 Tax=Ganoderma sinense ZZ0214-1 TaxID=1077348 RepID=A0A2G8RYQ2_9APHY|nr:hypothetical protein GSI_11267 [Ganoderma sinense ZZ0214-1]
MESLFTQEELRQAGLFDDGGASQFVRRVLETMQKHPQLLKLSPFTLECMNSHLGRLKSLSSPGSQTFSDASTTASALLGIPSSVTTVSEYSPSEWEKETYYHGVSFDHPKLLYRSNYLHTPFPTGRFKRNSTKSVVGVYNTPLNPVWHTVAPKIREVLKAHKIRYAAIHAVRFVTHGKEGEDEKDSLGPVVIWIATHPASRTHPTGTTADDAHRASPDILALLEANGVHGAVVEWFEGALERLFGPPLLRVTPRANPTYHVRRFLTPALGMPIATAERENEDVQGSVAFFFHENKDKDGNDSTRVLAVSNCHVLHKDPTVPYQFEPGRGARQRVRLAGFRRFQRGVDEIVTAIAHRGVTADLRAREIVGREPQLESEDAEQAGRAGRIVDSKRERLAEALNDIAALEAFHGQVCGQWCDINRRNIGHVDWAPEISTDVDGHGYTRDIGTFEVDAERFRAEFEGNVVDLGKKYTPDKLIDKFYPDREGYTTAFEFPPFGQLRISGVLTREDLAAPDTCDSAGAPCIVVMKDGNASDLTVGRCAGLEAYTCDASGTVEAVEIAIFNYGPLSGSFSERGDSGALVFDGRGRMVGIVHSGLASAGNNHVTYATPAWWVVEQLKQEYPHADFDRDHF